jgi:hypothetical protein
MIARVPQLNWLVAAGLPESLIASQSCASRQSLDRTGLPPRHVVWGLSGLFRWAAVRGAFLSLFTLSVVAQTQCSVTLAWDPSPGDSIVGYNLYYGSASRTYTNIDQVGDVTQVTVTNLCPGATYYFAITSVDASETESDYSTELIYTVPLALATLQLRVTSTGQAILDACSVALAWDPDSGDNIAGYNLYYGPGSLTYTNMVQVGDVTQATVTNLCPGATYYFAITSVDASGAESDYSAELIYTVPRALATLQLRVTPTGQAILDATGLAGQSYDILAAPSLGSWTNLGTLTLGADGTSEFIDSTAAGQPSCFYRLRGK